MKLINYYPVFLNLKDKICVVIGGGKVAERKIKSLLDCEAHIKLISPEITEDLKKLWQEKKIEWEQRKYKEGDLKGAFLVIAATSDKEVQKKIFKEAEERRIFCNVVDVPELCTFIVPSVIRRGELCIAISTSGASPALSRRIREKLEKEFSPSWEHHLKLIRHIRQEVLSSNLSPEEKEKKLTQFAFVPFYIYFERKEIDLIESILKKENISLPSWLKEGLNR